MSSILISQTPAASGSLYFTSHGVWSAAFDLVDLSEGDPFAAGDLIGISLVENDILFKSFVNRRTLFADHQRVYLTAAGPKFASGVSAPADLHDTDLRGVLTHVLGGTEHILSAKSVVPEVAFPRYTLLEQASLIYVSSLADEYKSNWFIDPRTGALVFGSKPSGELDLEIYPVREDSGDNLSISVVNPFCDLLLGKTYLGFEIKEQAFTFNSSKYHCTLGY